MSDALGTYMTRKVIERNTLEHVSNWFEYFLAQIEADEDLPAHTLAVPKSWKVTDTFQKQPENALPFVDVISIGTERGRRPTREGDGTVTAWYSIAVGAAVSARGTQEAKDLAGFYGTAIMLLMSQIPDLGGWANGCEWTGEAFDDWPTVNERTIATVREVFTVEVQGVMNVFSRPTSATPPIDPYSPDTGPPDVTTVDFDLERTS